MFLKFEEMNKMKPEFCERREHMKQRGLNSEHFCHCTEDNKVCTMDTELARMVEHLRGCCMMSGCDFDGTTFDIKWGANK